MVVLFGKSASGKDTVANILCAHYNFCRCAQVTTRPMRPDETQGNPYTFVCNEAFKNLKTLRLLVAHKSFTHIIGTQNKKVHYGIMESALVPKPDYISVLTTDIEMAQQLKKRVKNTAYENSTCFIELTCDDLIRYARQEMRGVPYSEIVRRAKDERKVYENSEKVRDHVLDTTYKTPDEVANMVYTSYMKFIDK